MNESKVRFRQATDLDIIQRTVCEDCGAMIALSCKAAHERFHSILSGHAWALAVLKTSHIASNVHDKFDVIERIDSRYFDSWTNDALAEVLAESQDDASQEAK